MRVLRLVSILVFLFLLAGCGRSTGTGNATPFFSGNLPGFEPGQDLWSEDAGIEISPAPEEDVPLTPTPDTVVPPEDLSITIGQVDPFGSLPGEEVTVRGKGFASGDGKLSIYINAVAVPEGDITLVDDEELRFLVPTGAKSGSLKLRVGEVFSNTVFFAVTPMRAKEPEDVLEDEAGGILAADQVLFMLGPGYDKADAQAIANSEGAELVGWAQELGLYQVELSADSLPELWSAVDSIQMYPSVVAAAPNVLLEEEKVTTDVGGLSGGYSDLYDQIHAEEAWEWLEDEVDNGTQFYHVGLGILERSVDFSHQEMALYAEGDPVFGVALAGVDGVSEHGTVVASLVAGINGNGDMNGILGAVQAGGFAIYVGDPSGFSMSKTVLLQAYIDMGLTVVNMSFGHTRDDYLQSDGSALSDNANAITVATFDSQKTMYDRFFETALEDNPDVVFIASAGNGNAEAAGHLPGGLSHPNLITVAAVDSSGKRAWFSNYGATVDIAASGEDIRVPDIDGAARTGGVITSYEDKSGTSYATPLVVATAALMKSLNPNLSASRIKELLRESSTQIQSKGVAETNAAGGTDTKPLTGIHPEYKGDDVPGCLLNIHKALQRALKEAEGIGVDDPIEVELKDGEQVTIQVQITLDQKIFSLLDVAFLVDVSGSFDDDIETYKSTALDILDGLSAQAADVQFGVASFSDFPLGEFGDDGDHAYQTRQTITDKYDYITDALATLNNPLESGDDGPESQLEALYQIATGAGRDVDGDGQFDSMGDIPPQPIGWRAGSLPVLVFSTDADFHDSDLEPDYPGAGFAQALSTVNSRGIVVVGLDSGDTEGDLPKVVEATNGVMYELGSDSSGIVAAILNAMDTITSKVDLVLKPVGDIYGIVQAITPDIITDVGPGETRSFSVTLAGAVLAGDEPKTIVFSLAILGNDVAIIKQIPVVVTVPSS